MGPHDLSQGPPHSPAQSLISLFLTRTSSSLQSQDVDHEVHRLKRHMVTYSMMADDGYYLAVLVLFIIAIFIVNVFFIVVILWSKTLRSSSKHVLILCLAVGDLMQGLLSLPLIAYLGDSFKGSEFDCGAFQVARLFADFLFPSIITLYVLALNIDYIMRLSWNLYSEGLSRAIILGVLVATPWLFGCLILVPIYAAGVQNELPFEVEGSCKVVIEGVYTRPLLVLSYFVFGVLVTVFTLTVAVVYLIKREYLGLDVTGERLQAPFDICFVSFILILFYTPIFLFTVLTTEGYVGCVGKEECRKLSWSYTLSVWLMFTKSWMAPLVWFFGRDTRKGLKEIYGYF